jgi:hypothetical protein
MSDRAASSEVQEIEITPEMIEAGYVVFGPFNRDVWEMTEPKRMEDMLRAVYTAMRSVEDGADVKSGIRDGLALYPFPTSE